MHLLNTIYLDTVHHFSTYSTRNTGPLQQITYLFYDFSCSTLFSQRRSIQISFQQQHWIKKLKQVMWCGRALLWMMNNFINERGISSFWRVQPAYLRPSPSRCSIWKPASASATRLLTLDICKWYNISTIILHCVPQLILILDSNELIFLVKSQSTLSNLSRV